MRRTQRHGWRGRSTRLAIVGMLVVAGLAPPLCLADLHFERVGGESGSLPSVVTALYQDCAGFVWVGSRSGLTMFDGSAYTTFKFDPADPASLSDNAIRTIFEDRANRLWIGTNSGGLNRLDRSTWRFEHFRHDSSDPTSISHDSVYAIAEAENSDLWIGTQRGLNRFDAKTGAFERVPLGAVTSSEAGTEYVLTLYVDRTGRLWVGTLGEGLKTIDPDSGVVSEYRHDEGDPRSIRHDSVTCMAEDADGLLWVGTTDGLDVMDPGDRSFRRFPQEPADRRDFGNPVITSLAPGPNGALWVGTHGEGLGAIELESRTLRTWRRRPGEPHGLSNDRVMALLRDAGGALWVGTWGGGLNRISPVSLLLSGPAIQRIELPRVDDPDVTAMMRDSRDAIWIGTATGFVMRRNPDSDTNELFLRGGPQGVARIILDFAEDRDGRIWIGTNGGVVRLEPATGRTTDYGHDPRKPDSLGPGYVKEVLVDRSGALWVGSGEGGVQRMDENGRVTQRFLHDPADPNSLSDNYVTVLVEDDEGGLWVGTRSGGLNKIDRRSGRVLRFGPDPDDDHALSHHYVTSILEDSRGRFWVATAGGGLNRAETDAGGGLRFTLFTEEDGLIDDTVVGMLEDDDANLWLSTKRGLSRFDPESGSFTNVLVTDGLPAAEFESNSAARARDALWFGSVSGPVAVPARTTFPSPEPSPVRITSIQTTSGKIVADRPIWDVGEIEIPFGEQLFIELALLDFVPGHRHLYAYRLGEDWVQLGSSREIAFTSLNPGTHEFSVKGRNCQGVWSEPSRPLAITVVPPFWMTAWFRVIALSIVLLAIVAGHRMRMAAVTRRNRELERLHDQREKARRDLGRAYDRLRLLTRRLEVAKEDERKRIARELHDELGQTLSAVRINVQLLRQDVDPSTAAKRFEDTIELVDHMIEHVGDISLDLRPPLLDDLGLLPALRGYLGALGKRAGIEIEIRDLGTARALPPEIEITGFRVLQEAVTNVIRHSGANRVTISVKCDDGHLDVTARDDGRGFDVENVMASAVEGGHLGLLGIQERVSMLGGEVELRSTIGEGTELRVRLPLEVPS